MMPCRLVAVSLLAAASLLACSGGGAAPSGGAGGGGPRGDEEPAAMKGMTAAHNAVRAAVSPPADPAIAPLAWASDVASTAQAWAEHCSFEHSQGSYGENIFASSGNATPKDVVDSWVSEESDYDYASNTCTAVCGHYTQVVWRDSVRLGCGVASCTQNSPFGSGAWQFWVCNYDLPGNFNGEKPY